MEINMREISLWDCITAMEIIGQMIRARIQGSLKVAFTMAREFSSGGTTTYTKESTEKE